MVLVLLIFGALAVIVLVGYLCLKSKAMDKAKITKKKQDEFDVDDF